jgi:hypothetical protein
MNVLDVKARVAEIIRANSRGENWDDESAHYDEDVLHSDVLEAIAAGTCEDPKACAAAALETSKLEFSRWYA